MMHHKTFPICSQILCQAGMSSMELRISFPCTHPDRDRQKDLVNHFSRRIVCQESKLHLRKASNNWKDKSLPWKSYKTWLVGCNFLPYRVTHWIDLPHRMYQTSWDMTMTTKTWPKPMTKSRWKRTGRLRISLRCSNSVMAWRIMLSIMTWLTILWGSTFCRTLEIVSSCLCHPKTRQFSSRIPTQLWMCWTETHLTWHST